MPSIRFTPTKQLDQDKQRVLGVLEAQLPREGLPAADLRDLLVSVGLDLPAAALQAVAAALVADGVIEVA